MLNWHRSDVSTCRQVWSEWKTMISYCKYRFLYWPEIQILKQQSNSYTVPQYLCYWLCNSQTACVNINTFLSRCKYKVWLHCAPPAGQRVSFLLRAALLVVLLCGPQHVVSDSDEAVLTEWEIWKSMHGITYDELVRQTPHLNYKHQH